MVSLYLYINSNNRDKANLAVIFQGVIFQLSRRLQIFLQKSKKEENTGWRPSAIAISAHSFQHLGAFELLTWISRKYGFGTYLHVIKGYLSRESNQEAQECKERLIKMAESNASNIFIESIVSPSYTSAIAQAVQLPGIAGIKNNVFLFEFDKNGPNHLEDIVENLKLIKAVDFDVILLGSSPRGFGLHRDIHIWITSRDYFNANLMILLAYIIVGHPDWKNAQIKIFAIYPQEFVEQERERLLMLIEVGRLPISKKNIELITTSRDELESDIIESKSKDADLTLIGFREELVKHSGSEFFGRFEDVGNVLFINSAEEIPIMQ
ncbi:MAG: amino acid permease, partial [Saprospiraceae bacterium]|nr:amino acid permease [Saprospiraceae bacterium]